MGDTETAVRACINGVASATRRRDAEILLEMMGRITGASARMWNASIIGFGQYHYKYASGREGDAPAAGFSPRKGATTIYFSDGVGAYAEPLKHLGEHTTGVACLYIKDLSKVDMAVLEGIIKESFQTLASGTYEHRAHESAEGRPTPRAR